MISPEQTEPFDITADEMDRIKESLKNEEFRKLFMDYVQEISDPKNKAIYENELAQLESEQGNDTRFVKPEAGHVIKTFQGDLKTFINLCHSSEIKVATMNLDKNQSGQAWSIPYSLAKPRDDLDSGGKKCQVFDCVFHPETYHLSTVNPAFKKLLESTAIEGIEKEFKLSLQKDYKLPKLKSKGTIAMTMIRTPNPNLKKQKTNETTSEYLQKLAAKSAHSEASKSLIQDITDTPIISSKKNTNQTIETPVYTITHQIVNSDYQKFTNAKERAIEPRPDAIVVKVKLPKLVSIGEADLEISELKFELVVKTKYSLSFILPFPVVSEKGEAKFDKSKKELIVTLPVVPAVKMRLPEIEASEEECENELKQNLDNQKETEVLLELQGRESEKSPFDENTKLSSNVLPAVQMAETASICPGVNEDSVSASSMSAVSNAQQHLSQLDIADTGTRIEPSIVELNEKEETTFGELKESEKSAAENIVSNTLQSAEIPHIEFTNSFINSLD